ncbi:MAG: hypothetical protein RLZZ15_2229 [Verrucomicrobiota bacterium]|jgi:hypothetical protein
MHFAPRFLVAAGFLAVAPFTLAAKIERLVEKSFTVAPGGKIRLETQGGEIRVAPGADGVVKITAKEKIRASTEAEADEIVGKLDLSFEQSGDTVSAVSKYPKPPLGFHFGAWPPVQVDFVVTVPASFAAELRTSGGIITVGDLDGKIHARTSGGDIKLGKLGGDVDAHTSGGHVSLGAARGTVKLGTSGGNISAGPVAGAADLSTSGGHIKIESVTGALRAHTSGGNIRARLGGPLKEECSLHTSGGSVRVDLDRTAAFRLDAATSGGSVDAQGLTITLEKPSRNRTALAGNVNGGGPLLKLRTSGGDVVVKTL